MKTLKMYVNGEFVESKATKFNDIYNPSTGEVLVRTPICPVFEVEYAIKSAKAAFAEWSNMPVLKRVQFLFKFRELLVEHLDELTRLLATEEGKVLSEAKGDVLKGIEAVEFACSAPTLMMGESIMNTSRSIDTVLYRYPLGVFASITPFNFPGMIPLQLTAMCIATGNTLVNKASSTTPMTGLRMMELLQDTGLPKGVVNMLTCSRNETDYILEHEDIKGVSFVGSTPVGRHIYALASAHDKRAQCMAGAKNHGIVLEDCTLERTARGVVAASFGCAGERCMALPVLCVQESIADEFVDMMKKFTSELKVGPAYESTSAMGPLVTRKHRDSVVAWIQKGVEEGAELALDGRDIVVQGYENGFYLGPTILDHVTEEMSVGREEIFGPVVCIKRVKDFDEAMEIANANPFSNGMSIFTNSGYYARRFAFMSHSGQCGINVGIPVTPAIFPFSGQKKSYFGCLHNNGKDAVRFYTECKTVTTRWFDEEEANCKHVGTWDGMLSR